MDKPRYDPNRSDWLSNIWLYLDDLEKRISALEKQIADFKRPKITFHPPHIDDED